MAGLGLNGALWLGYSGLATAQLQVNTAGRNLANTNTPGASRQVVNVTEDNTVNIGGTNLSMGSYALGVTGTRSQYLDTAVQQENANLGSITASNTFLNQVQNALQEQLNNGQVDGGDSSGQTGLEAATTNFFTAWSQLSANPTDGALRDAVSAAAVNFSSTANSIYTGMLASKQSVFTEANGEVSNANTLITQIAKLNQQIASDEAGTANPLANQAADLRDQREELVEQLSSMVNITVTTDAKSPSMIDIQLADSNSANYQVSSVALGASTPSPGTVTINGTQITIGAGDSLADVAATINSSVSNVSATVSASGKLILTSLSPITVGGGATDTSTFAADSGLDTATPQTPTTSAPIMLVQGVNGGGATYNGVPDSSTYSLSVSGATQDSDGYGADKSLTILATNGTGTTTSTGITGGTLGGMVTFDNKTLGFQDETNYASGSTLLDRFNSYINNVVTTVNGLVAGGFDLDGNPATGNPPAPATPAATGGSFFYDNTNSTASVGAWNLQVNAIYDYTNTAYNSDNIPAATTAVTTGQSGDGTLATQIGNAVNNADIYDFYSKLVSDIGEQTSASNTNLTSQNLVSNQAVTAQQSYSGISTDEEMTDLMSFQRAYEASSRFINTINQMYQLITTNLGT